MAAMSSDWAIPEFPTHLLLHTYSKPRNILVKMSSLAAALKLNEKQGLENRHRGQLKHFHWHIFKFGEYMQKEVDGACLRTDLLGLTAAKLEAGPQLKNMCFTSSPASPSRGSSYEASFYDMVIQRGN